MIIVRRRSRLAIALMFSLLGVSRCWGPYQGVSGPDPALFLLEQPNYAASNLRAHRRMVTHLPNQPAVSAMPTLARVHTRHQGPVVPW
jgi:hypothetical protein